MKTTKKQFTSIPEYINTFPKHTKEALRMLRIAIQKSAPRAEEKISYQMPTFVQKGNLVHFAGYKNHIGFYPSPSGIAKFQKELSIYKSAKASVQFPIDRPLPLSLIAKIVKFRVQENLARFKMKKSRK